jgi:hypothetical protein
MDKLELDERVSRLERRVSFLWALALLALVAAGLFMAAMMFIARSTPYPPPPVESPSAVYIDRGLPPGAITFEAELRRLHDLQQKGLITASDFAEKKAKILGRSMEFSDEAEAVKAAKALNNAGIITAAEYDDLKRRILKLVE